MGFKSASTQQIIDKLGLTPEQLKALRKRLRELREAA